VVEITTDNGLWLRQTLPDSMGDAIVTPPGPAQYEVMIRIVDVYPGTHYRDTCLNGVFIDFEWEEMQMHGN